MSVIVGTGEYADLALAPDGRVILAAENAARDAVNVYADARGQTRLASLAGAFVGDRIYALYPRVAVNPFGEIAVCYQQGPCIALALLGQAFIVRSATEEPFGTEMVCISWLPVLARWRLAYVARAQGVIRLYTRDYDRAGAELPGSTAAPTDTTQGISRILSDGSVVLVDQDFIWGEFPNLSRPVRAGAICVGQANDAPARALGYLGQFQAPPAYRIFDGLAFRPRAVETAPGRWTVIAAGQSGIRVVDVPPFVRDAQPPVEPPAVERPRVTIIDYQPRAGTAPMIVSIDVQLSGGPASLLTVTAESKQPFTVEHPTPRSTIAFGFDRAGRYAIAASVVGPGGEGHTEATRIITVHEKKEEPMPLKPYPDEIAIWKPKVEAAIVATYAEAGRIVDLEPVRWSNRTMYDYLAGLSLEASIAKHVHKELRAELGLPAVPDPFL